MKFKALALLIISITLCSFSFLKLSEVKKDISANRPEVLYLPSGKGLNFVSLGYRNTLAHFLWFQTINYFGKHYRADRNYDWLAHYCNLVSTLNPREKEYYRFCGAMLAWEANKYEESNAVYSKAIAAYPDDWLFYFLRGFNYMFFLKDESNAKADFVTSAKLPNAHYFVARLASKKFLAEGKTDDAKEFLKEAIAMTSDPQTRSILLNKLRQIEASSKQENK